MTRLEAIARLSSKSQVAIPKPVRDRMGVGPGDLIVFEVRNGKVVVRRAPRAVTDIPLAMFTEWSGPADSEAYNEF
jgi:antitoxin PrlF